MFDLFLDPHNVSKDILESINKTNKTDNLGPEDNEPQTSSVSQATAYVAGFNAPSPESSKSIVAAKCNQFTLQLSDNEDGGDENDFGDGDA